ncbi:MAG: hypothetical protein IPP29_01555 [Bacteroidetes bacterium]|nr:hypothetical protein [Bacteroidota bacterium]
MLKAGINLAVTDLTGMLYFTLTSGARRRTHVGGKGKLFLSNTPSNYAANISTVVPPPPQRKLLQIILSRA